MTISDRIDAVTAIPLSHRHEFIPAPRSVKIELTADCQYRCTFCVKSVRPENGTMSRDLFSRLIRDLKQAGVEECGLFFIGESFTCSWLPDAIKEAKDVGFEYVFLTTNGSIASPARVRACMEAGLDSLKFSINFTDATQLQSIAQVSGVNWKRAIDNLKEARVVRDSGQYKCGLYASSIAFDGEQGEKMKAVMADVEPHVDEMYWLPLYSMSGASKEHGYKPKAGNPGRLANMRDPLPCWSAFTEAHITHDGLLAACCFGSGIDGSLIMADLKEVSFKEGWNSEAFRKLRRAHLFKDVSGTACAECAAG